MLAPSFSISPHDFWSLIGGPQAPQIIDARRREFYDASEGVLPTAAEGRHSWPAKAA